MFNLFNKNNLSLEFLTNNKYSYAHEYFPVQRSSRFIPNWFKNTPKSSVTINEFDDQLPEYYVHKTVRGCIGIQNMMTGGVVIPWWTDLQISANDQGYRYLFSDGNSDMTFHQNYQAPGFLDDYHLLHIKCPWIVRSSRKMKFMMTSYFYGDHQSDAIFIPGVLETLTKNNLSNLHFFFAVKRTAETRTYNFKSNTPALQLIPLTEDAYTVSNSTLPNEEFEKLRAMVSTDISAVNSGLLMRKLSKCPFHNKD